MQNKKVKKVKKVKKIHIVFQVLNFLSNPSISSVYNLTSDEKLLLIFLVKHRGKKGIYPSLKTLSVELGVNYRSARRTLDRLKKKQLIEIEYVKGRSSRYFLMLELIHTQGVHTLTPVNRPRASTPSHPGRAHPEGEGVHTLRINKINNLINKTERSARKKRVPLSDDFYPTEKLQKFADEVALKLNTNFEWLFKKFKNVVKSKDKRSADWNAEWENFLLTERPSPIFGNERRASHHSQNEIRSTVTWYKPSEIPRATVSEIKMTKNIPTPQEVVAIIKADRVKRLNGNKQHGELKNDDTIASTPRSGDS